MGAIGNIQRRLELLIPMLSSPNDGEVVNAVRLIEKTLKSENLDWHDLTRELFKQQGFRAYSYSPPPPPRPKTKRTGWRPASTNNGSLCGVVGDGFNSTISRSTRQPGMWRVVVNTDHGPEWFDGFPTTDHAREYVEKLYGEYR